MKMAFLDILGWFGTAIIVTMYGLATTGLVPADMTIALVFNIFGCAAVAVSMVPKRAYQAIVLQGVWAVIALVGLIRNFLL